MIPESFKCPITKDVMKDPVVVADGHTYERTCIERWLFEKNKKTSPMTNQTLPNLSLTPNYNLKSQIQQWRQEQKGDAQRQQKEMVNDLLAAVVLSPTSEEAAARLSALHDKVVKTDTLIKGQVLKRLGPWLQSAKEMWSDPAVKAAYEAVEHHHQGLLRMKQIKLDKTKWLLDASVNVATRRKEALTNDLETTKKEIKSLVSRLADRQRRAEQLAADLEDPVPAALQADFRKRVDELRIELHVGASEEDSHEQGEREDGGAPKRAKIDIDMSPVFLEGLKRRLSHTFHGEVMIVAAADAGEPWAKAFCTFQGWNREQNEAEASRQFQQLAEQPGAPHVAMYHIALCYGNADGVGKDDAKAFGWYTKAAEAGLKKAMCRVGDCYRYARGVAKDEDRAAEWYTKAAEAGNGEAPQEAIDQAAAEQAVAAHAQYQAQAEAHATAHAEHLAQLQAQAQAQAHAANAQAQAAAAAGDQAAAEQAAAAHAQYQAQAEAHATAFRKRSAWTRETFAFDARRCGSP